MQFFQNFFVYWFVYFTRNSNHKTRVKWLLIQHGWISPWDNWDLLGSFCFAKDFPLCRLMRHNACCMWKPPEEEKNLPNFENNCGSHTSAVVNSKSSCSWQTKPANEYSNSIQMRPWQRADAYFLMWDRRVWCICHWQHSKNKNNCINLNIKLSRHMAILYGFKRLLTVLLEY